MRWVTKEEWSAHLDIISDIATLKLEVVDLKDFLWEYRKNVSVEYKKILKRLEELES